MWIGTRMGLYLLDKQSGVYRYIDLPVESLYICALYQREDGILYIGTRGAGLLVYDINKKKFIHQYRTDNCALISDNIYSSASGRESPDGYGKWHNDLFT